jgi:hypothetical protein
MNIAIGSTIIESYVEAAVTVAEPVHRGAPGAIKQDCEPTIVLQIRIKVAVKRIR